MKQYSLPVSQKFFLGILSFLIVAFGQPAWFWWVGLLASMVGFALFWRVLLAIPQKMERFFIAAGWYASVQIVQISWMASHPFLYIYGVILLCAWLVGLQFGLLALWIRPSTFTSLYRILALAAFWIIMEWSRLFMLSGLAFNPSGIALTGALYPSQLASLGGVYLLSFWVIFCNALALRAWLFHFKGSLLIAWGAVSLFPFLFGWLHTSIHVHKMTIWEKEHPPLAALLVQPAFPVEENLHFQSYEEARRFVMNEWQHILTLIQRQAQAPIDLIVLPEYVVPYGTHHPIFPLTQIREMFTSIFGSEVEASLPHLEEPYAAYIETSQGPQWLVSNAFFSQALANIFKADVVIGLEDSVKIDSNHHESYSSAYHFAPNQAGLGHHYEKRILVPMGEYIPFDFCRSMAAAYGITSSFTCGKTAQVFPGKVPFSPSICYEEMYGHLMHEGRALGAQLFVNLTNDGWYPSSKLPQQHFDHSRLRTVENGVPLIRACNTGITGAVDSLGRIVKVLGSDPLQLQLLSDALYVQVPTYHYKTLYARWGDSFIIGWAFLLLATYPFYRRKDGM